MSYEAKKLSFSNGSETIFVNSNDVLFIRSDREMVIIHYLERTNIPVFSQMAFTSGFREKHFVMKKTMAEIEEKLRPLGFCRTHKSFIVALDKVLRVSGNKVKLSNSDYDDIPIGRVYMKNFRARMDSIYNEE